MATEAKLESLQSKQNLIVRVFHSQGVRHSLTHPPHHRTPRTLVRCSIPVSVLHQLVVGLVIKRAASQFLQLHRGSPCMKCTPHSESRQQLMRDYLLAEAWHTPHHNLQLVQFTVICWVDLTLPFPRLFHKQQQRIKKGTCFTYHMSSF